MLPSVAAGPSRSPTPGPRIAVLGAGISGLCMAVRLKEAGLDAFTVFEKAPDLGGTLEDTWAAGAEAYLGVTVPGFPNLFMLYGPNTNLGHNSIIFMIECQVAYVVECLRRMRREGLATVEVRRDVARLYNAALQAELSRTVWATGCNSWYKTKDGKITNNWSRSTAAYWWKTRRPDWSAFSVERG